MEYKIRRMRWEEYVAGMKKLNIRTKFSSSYLKEKITFENPLLVWKDTIKIYLR